MMDGNFIGYTDLKLLPMKKVFKLTSALSFKTVILFAYINNLE